MKRKIFSILVILIFVLSSYSFASADVSSGIYGGTTCTVGDNVQVRVEYSGSGLAAGKCSVTVEDGNILSFVSSSAGTVNVSPNNPTFVWEVKDGDMTSGVSTANFYLTFKANNAGTTKIYLSTSDISDINGSSLSGGSDSVTVTVNNPAKSGNNSLSSITPSKGELNPQFSSDVTDYTLTVEYSEEEVVFGYKTEHSGASASINGSNALAVGSNERTITVTAANGSIKKYRINIIRAEEDGTLPDGTNLYEIRKLNALSINVNDVIYMLVDDISGYKVPSGFLNEVVKYNEYDIPVLTLKKTGIKMAYALPVDATSDVTNETEEVSEGVSLDTDTTNDVALEESEEAIVEETDDSSFKGGIWVFYDEEAGMFLPSYLLKGEEAIDLTHYLLFGDEDEPVEEPSILDDKVLVFAILGTLAILLIVVVCLQISILKGREGKPKKEKKRKKKKDETSETEEETSSDEIETTTEVENVEETETVSENSEG